MRGILEIKPKNRKFDILKDYKYIKNIDYVLNLNVKVGDKLILNGINYEVVLALEVGETFFLDVEEII